VSAGAVLLIAVIVLATSFLSGIFGMAGGMIYMGALLLLLPVPAAMVLHGVTQTASNGWRAYLWRGYVAWPILRRYLIGAALAFGAFTLVRFVPDPALVLVVLGLTPFLAWMVPDGLAPRADRFGGAELCGFIGTAFQLLSGVSGPLLDVFFVRCPLDRRAVVATKAACQVATHLLKLVYFGRIIGEGGDELGWPVLVISVVLAMAGTSLSRAMLERLTDVQFRSWTQRIVLGVGLVYLLQGIAAYAGG
jgi:uncharacterized membrane protein YfcA